MRLLLVASLVTALPLFGCELGVYEHDPGGGGGGGGGGGVDGRYHPQGFAASDLHGVEFNLQMQDCRNCHGDDLAGDIAAPNCDTCHTPEAPQAWRSDCTFCHGGVDDMTGAPPGELDGNAADVAFGAHRAHLGTQIMEALACTDCHVMPTALLSPGHAFDDTPGAADVTFGGGRSPDGTYAAATCDNMYCHGDGRNNGTVMANAGAMGCGGCHGEPPNSGEHGEHGGDNCFECHNDTTKDDVTIANLALHIDGNRQVVIDDPGGLTVTNNGGTITCDGQCHGQGRDHQGDRW